MLQKNMLDPKCHGDDLYDKQIINAYEVIMAHLLDLTRKSVLACVAKYRGKDGW